VKTIKQIADENSVSVQTIYRLLNSVKQETGEYLTEKIKGTAYLSEKNELIVKQRLTGVKQVLNTVKHAESEEVVFLREQNKILQEELATERAHSREQADKLSDLAAKLAALSENHQVLLGREQARNSPALLTDEQETKKWWQLWKKD
jgi:DNA-binding LacI/PurR family transcriptional regulator